MKKLTLLTLLSTLLSFPIFSQYNSQNKKLDAMIVKGMADWKIPGLAAVVVKDGEVVFQKTYGVKDMDSKQPVDKNTLFTMASTTKALIAISIGMLVDQGKLKWDDKVRTHLPAFELSDPYITADARVQDLLTHNLGIGNADLLWIVDSTSTEFVLDKFKLAKTAYPLRGGFNYQNIMYVIAGELIEAVSGDHWTTFVEENVFAPLEMTRSQTQSKGILEAGNYATPHFDDLQDGLVKVPYTFSDHIGAAGMMWSSIADISNYLQFLDNGGIYKGDTLLQSATFNYLFQPQTLIPSNQFYPTQQLTKPNWRSYGLAWFQHDYRGEKLDFHTGSIPGLIAIAGIIHEKNTAVYVFSNLDHAELRHAILYKVMDLYAFNDADRDWHEEVFDLYSGFRQATIDGLKKQTDSRIMDTKPSVPLADFEGKYTHEMLGSVTVKKITDGLEFNFNDYRISPASHWHYNTFMTDKHPKWRGRLLINFNMDASGKVNGLDAFGETFTKSN